MELLNNGIRQKTEQEKPVTRYELWKIKTELQLIAQHNLLDPQNKSFVLVFHSAKGTTFQKNLLV